MGTCLPFSLCCFQVSLDREMSDTYQGGHHNGDFLFVYQGPLPAILPSTATRGTKFPHVKPPFYANEEGTLKASYFCTLLHLETHIMSHAPRKKHPETHSSQSHIEMALGGLYMLFLIQWSQDENHEIFSAHKNGSFYSVPIEETSILQTILSHWFYSS